MQQGNLGERQAGLCQALLLIQKDGGARVRLWGERECENSAALLRDLSDDLCLGEGGTNRTGLVVFMRSGAELGGVEGLGEECSGGLGMAGRQSWQRKEEIRLKNGLHFR